jgi:hypothetical protein
MSMIGSLMYLTATWPNIQFIVGLCACFEASPRFSHQTVVQQIFRYLKHTPEFGIWYSASSSLDLVGLLMWIHSYFASLDMVMDIIAQIHACMPCEAP